MREENPEERPAPNPRTPETAGLPEVSAAPGSGASEVGGGWVGQSKVGGGLAPGASEASGLLGGRPEVSAARASGTSEVGTAPGSGAAEVGAAPGAGSEVSAVPAPGSSEVGGVPVVPPAVGAGAGRRAPWWLVVVLLVVAVGAGFGAGALIWAGQVEKVYPPGYQGLTPEQYDKCVRGVIIYFSDEDPDPEMRAAAEELRHDDRFESVREETRQEAFDRFKEVFKDQPELVKLARPESLPAAVHMMVREGSTGDQVVGALRTEFPEADDVTTQSWCPPPE